MVKKSFKFFRDTCKSSISARYDRIHLAIECKNPKMKDYAFCQTNFIQKKFIDLDLFDPKIYEGKYEFSKCTLRGTEGYSGEIAAVMAIVSQIKRRGIKYLPLEGDTIKFIDGVPNESYSTPGGSYHTIRSESAADCAKGLKSIVDECFKAIIPVNHMEYQI